MRRAEAMHAHPNPARLSATVARLCEDAQRIAERIVADARDARQLRPRFERLAWLR